MVTALLLGAAVAGAITLWPRPSASHLGRRALDSVLVDTGSAGPGRRARAPWWRRWWLGLTGARATSPSEDDVVAVLDGLVPAVRAGLAPAAALSLVAQSRTAGDWRWLRPVTRAATAGHALAEPWREVARSHDIRALHHLARAWALSDELGAPLADVLATTAATVRADRERSRRLEAVTAGPRATVMVLSCLPLAGVGLAAVMGIGPGELYLGSPVGAAGLAVGLVLVLVGRRVVDHLVRRAVRGEVIA